MALFAPLPGGFPQLIQAVMGVGSPVLEPRPANVRSLAQQLRDAYALARRGHYDSLSPAQWRQLPYAYWDGGPAPLPDVEPGLVRRYWREVLRNALSSRPTLASRWLAPLFYTYVWSYRTGDRQFEHYAQEFVTRVEGATGPFAATLRMAHDRIGLLQPERLGGRLAHALLAYPGTIDGWLVEMCLSPDFPESALGQQVLPELLLSPQPTLRQEDAIGKVLAWTGKAGVVPHHSALRVPFANGLLQPWVDHRHTPAPAVCERLLTTFAHPDTYGDPRWVGRAGYQWQGVASDAVSVVKRWLAGKSLETFVNALKLTADDSWEYREKFWMAYHRRGYVDDVWLVLGSEAKDRIGHGSLGSGFRHGTLTNDSPGRRSVLLLRIGDLTFVEWSHNGAVRAYKTDDPVAPQLYRNEYDRDELADDRSLWMHDADAENKNAHLFHHGSDGGTWQRKARDFIRRQTGVHLPDVEIL